MTDQGLPHQRRPLMRWAGGSVLKLMGGWKIAGRFPAVPKAVVIAAPHTSNWDFIIGIAAKFHLELQVHWLGKHTLFRKPFDRLFRWLGGTPVYRDSSQGVVQQSVEIFEAHEKYLLAIAPEGTRKRVEQWKTGFYNIARAAGVPIVPVALDYSTKLIRIGEPVHLSESMEEDFAKLRKFYSNVEGKLPHNFEKDFSYRNQQS